VSSLFFLCTLITIFLLGIEIYKNSLIAVFSVFIFSFYLTIYDQSRTLFLDIPLTLFVILSYYFILKSRFFKHTMYTVCASVCISLACLTKISAFLYVAVITLYIVFQVIKRNNIQLFNTLLGLIIILICIEPWYVLNWNNILQYISINQSYVNIPAIKSQNPLEIFKWIVYIKQYIYYELTPFNFIFFIISVFYYCISKKIRFEQIMVISMLIICLIVTIFLHIDIRFLYPIFPFIALISAKGLIEMFRRHRWLTIPMVTFMIIYNISTYIFLSFGIPSQIQSSKLLTLPLVSNIKKFSSSNFPVTTYNYGYSNKYWPHNEILQRLSHTTKRGAKVLVLLNNQEVNVNNLIVYALLNNVKNFEFIDLSDTLDVNNVLIQNYIYNYDFVLYPENALDSHLIPNSNELISLRRYIDSHKQIFDVLGVYELPGGGNLSLLAIKTE
jgi:hypothetical protein